MSSPSLTAPAPSRTLDAVLERPWGKLLIPSFSDFYFIAVLVWLFIAGPAGWNGLLLDGDAGWHIRTGEYILDHGSVPKQDLFSYSKQGAAWYAWEWLSDVAFGSLHRAAGLKGVVLFAGVVIALACTILMRRIVVQGANLFITLILGLVATGASSIHFLARPHILTLLLLGISLWIIESDRREASWRLYLLIPITILWTNLHGGFLALIGCLGITAAGAAIEAWLNKSGWRQTTRYAAVTAGCLAASLVNPYGANLHVHIVAYLLSDWIRNVIQEFQSPSFRNENMLMFEALMLLGLIVAGALIRRRRIAEALWIVAFAHLALGSVRHVPVFIMVATPLIARELTHWWDQWTAPAPKKSVLAIFRQLANDATPSLKRSTFWPAAVVLALMFMGEPLRWPKEFPEEIFPVKIAHRHANQIAGARVLSTDQWADYLIYLNYPRQRVFVDGRSDFYGPEIGNQYLRLMNGNWDWDRIMSRHNFDMVLAPVDWPLASMLKRDPGWRQVEDDGKAILLVRR